MAQYEVSEDLREHLQLTVQELEDLRSAFQLFDSDGKGSISPDDYQTLTQSLGLNRPEEACNKKSNHRTSLKGVEYIDFTQFLQMTVHPGRRRRNSYQAELELREAFRTFDTDNKGYLTVEDIKGVMMRLGEYSISDTDIVEMMLEADHNNDNHISYDEFRTIMYRAWGDIE